MTEKLRIIPTGCAHNCGGRCPLNVYLRGNDVVRIAGDQRPDSLENPQLRACLKGRGYRRFLQHPDRLKYPLKRIGARGEGKFKVISWQEAVMEIAEEINRIKGSYGNETIYSIYGTGFKGLLNGYRSIRRLMSLIGGNLDYYSNYSSGQTTAGSPYTIGTNDTGHSREDLLNTKLFLIWGWNPAETIFGTNTMYYLRQAREKGARFISIDPRYTDTAAVLSDWHIPIRPTTDNALMDAMAYVIFSEELEDKNFLSRCCSGFDEKHMPPGAPAKESYRSWVMGETDGTPRTPGWAEEITGIPAEDIVRLAREYATTKPANLICGYGPQRHLLGEQPPRGSIQLAALTGNIGIPGGGAGGSGHYGRLPSLPGLPLARENQVKARIPTFLWSEAVKRGPELTATDGLLGVDKLNTGIKLLFNFHSNMMVNQHADINKITRLLQDESLCEFIVVSDIFLTPSARFADIVLPATTFMEKEDIYTSGWSDYLIYNNIVQEPSFERRSDYRWCLHIAEALGLAKEFTEGKTEQDWLREFYEAGQKRYSSLPSFEDFRRKGSAFVKYDKPHIPFALEVKNPEKHPFSTPSGKIEFFSQELYKMGRPREIPATSRYNPSQEGPEDNLKIKYPLQLITCHVKHRTHSIFANYDLLDEVSPHALKINPIDAQQRGISDGDRVRVFNHRGETYIIAWVTPRIMPGVVDLPQGKWYSPQSPGGADIQGSANVLTSLTPSPLAKANPHHTNLVQVERGKGGV